MAGQEQDAWVTRVLGVSLAATDDASASNVDVGEVWRTAKEAADQRLNQLAGKMRSTGHPDLIRIADFGLFGITGGGKGVNVALQKAVMEYTAAAPDHRPQAARDVRKATEQYRAALAKNPAIKLVDANPFGVDVGVAATLGAALDRIDASLS